MNKSMEKMVLQTFRFARIVGFFCATAVLVLPVLLEAAPAVTASYSISSGTRLAIDINVSSPPPASIILVQHFPAGTTMVSAQPGASNYNPRRNVAKWLLRNLRPGKSTVTVTLDRSVSPGEVSAEIRFKPMDGRGMETIPVSR